jgi:hypothetical protein
MKHYQAAVNFLRVKAAAKLHGGGNAGVFTAMNACRYQKGGAVESAVYNCQGYFYFSAGYRQHGAQLAAAADCKATYG